MCSNWEEAISLILKPRKGGMFILISLIVLGFIDRFRMDIKTFLECSSGSPDCLEKQKILSNFGFMSLH